jgi:hypothetical protein
MKRPQPWIPKLPIPEVEHVDEVVHLYPNPPLTEEQKKWPVVPLSKMSGRPKKKPESEPEKQPSDPS